MFSYPIFLQLHFRSDWLNSNPVSYEKVISSPDESMHDTKQWKPYQVPILYTPINSAEILKQKRLLIAVRIATFSKAENFAYINLDLSGLKKSY